MLNKYLNSLMPGLTAKVFRTFNASITLQEQLKATPVDGTVDEKMLAYNRANREVAVLCNHQVLAHP
jgi:DNA topoisomerase-1